jgi:hypothetical protein
MRQSLIHIGHAIEKTGPLPSVLFSATHLFNLFARHYPVIPGHALLWEILLFTAVAVTSALILAGFTKSWIKSNTIAIVLLAFEFHFSSFHGFLKTGIGSNVWSSYTIIIPMGTIILGVAIFLLARKPRKIFLSFLMGYSTIVLIYSAGLLLFNSIWQDNGSVRNEWKILKSTPDITLVVFDQYTGPASLKSYFGFDNTQIGDFLKQNGFQQINTKSLYNSTPFSIASLFEMDSLQLDTKISYDRNTQNIALSKINKNRFVDFLHTNNYAINNLSVFPFANTSPLVEYQDQLITGKDLLRYYNTTATIWRDLSYHLYTKNWLGYDMTDFRATKILAHRNIIERTKNTAQNVDEQVPNFTYSHLFLPHPPYIYKADGSLRDIKTYQIERDKEKYIDQLKYTNRVIMDLTKHLNSSKKNSIIIFMSDHGYHYFDEPTETGIEFDNILFIKGLKTPITDSVYIPNIFPVILDQLYDTTIPKMKNTRIYLKGNH